MSEEIFKAMAAQLRQPSGAIAVQVGEKMNEGNRFINIETIRVLKPAPGDHILEIGMGNGFFVKDIVCIDKTIRYTGCDFSAAMVEEAIKLNDQFVLSGQARFYLTGADKLDFEQDIFDKVFTVNTIYFWEDQQEVLSQIHRVLKPGGSLIIALRPKSMMKDYPFTRYGFTMFTKEELSDLLSENGFSVKDVIEMKEPDMEINERKIPVETLIVSAIKI